MNEPWHDLERIPPAMADAVRPLLAAVSLDGYRRFLDAMVHYTRGSGDRLRHAAARAPTDDLRLFFDRLAREESGHHRLAEADLAALGRAPGDVTPAPVTAFHRFWMDGDAATWLGALYALESVGAHLQADAVQHLGRLALGPDQVRFVLVHLEVDVDHGASTEAHARRLPAEAAPRLLEAARRAADFWVGLHRDTLTADGP